MKLIAEELEKRFAEVGAQQDEKDPIVVAKFFSPTGSATWWAIATTLKKTFALAMLPGCLRMCTAIFH